jgi:hypothetical protein
VVCFGARAHTHTRTPLLTRVCQMGCLSVSFRCYLYLYFICCTSRYNISLAYVHYRYERVRVTVICCSRPNSPTASSVLVRDCRHLFRVHGVVLPPSPCLSVALRIRYHPVDPTVCTVDWPRNNRRHYNRHPIFNNAIFAAGRTRSDSRSFFVWQRTD